MTLGWFDDGSSKVTVMATYAGDFNLDGVVDQSGPEHLEDKLRTGTAWQMGDANYDGTVNGLDLDMWKANVGLPPSAAAPASGSSRAWHADAIGRRAVRPDGVCLAEAKVTVK